MPTFCDAGQFRLGRGAGAAPLRETVAALAGAHRFLSGAWGRPEGVAFGARGLYLTIVHALGAKPRAQKADLIAKTVARPHKLRLGLPRALNKPAIAARGSLSPPPATCWSIMIAQRKQSQSALASKSFQQLAQNYIDLCMATATCQASMRPCTPQRAWRDGSACAADSTQPSHSPCARWPVRRRIRARRRVQSTARSSAARTTHRLRGKRESGWRTNAGPYRGTGRLRLHRGPEPRDGVPLPDGG